MAAARLMCIFTVPCIILSLAASIAAVPGQPSTTSFINLSCQVTLYPDLCVKSLTLYAASIKLSPQKLTHTALIVSLAKVKATRAYISMLAEKKGLGRPEREALKDCLVNMGAAEDRIRGSVREMGMVGRASAREFRWRMSNVQTWVSAALTGENTCGDGLGDGRVGARISPLIVDVKQATSNALALINRFVEQKL